MKLNIFKSIFVLLVTSFAFVACEDDFDKDEYDVEHSLTVEAIEPSEVSFGYAVFSLNEIGDVETGILVSSNQELNDPMIEMLPEGESEIRVTGLSPNTTYYYAPYGVSNDNGTGVGDVQSFSTPEAITAFDVNYATSSLEEWQNAGFSTIDADGDGNDWGLAFYDQGAEQYAYASYSWLDSPLTPENYLLFPAIDYAGQLGFFNLTLTAGDNTYYAETVKLLVSTQPIDQSNAANAEVLLEHTLQSGNNFSTSIEIPQSYEGETLYFALVHTDVTDMYVVYMLGANFIYAE